MKNEKIFEEELQNYKNQFSIYTRRLEKNKYFPEQYQYIIYNKKTKKEIVSGGWRTEKEAERMASEEFKDILICKLIGKS